VACLRSHQPASGDAGVSAGTTPADPGGKRGIERNRDGEGGNDSKAQMHTRAARGGSTEAVRCKGGSIPTPHVDRVDRTLCAATTSGDRAQGGSRRCLHVSTKFKALATSKRLG
jgi:hypothetical protein